MNRSCGIGLGVVLVLATAACATRPASPAQIGEGGEDDTVLVTVRNHDFQDAVIYANWNGLRRRVGMVVGKTTETFRVTWRTNQIRLEVDFIGGGELRHRAGAEGPDRGSGPVGIRGPGPPSSSTPTRRSTPRSSTADSASWSPPCGRLPAGFASSSPRIWTWAA